MFAHCDVVLVEDDSQTTATKIEVWRQAAGSSPLALSDPTIAAVVSDDTPEGDLGVPIWPRANLQNLAKQISSLLNGQN